MTNDLLLEGYVSYTEADAIRHALPPLEEQSEYDLFDNAALYGEAIAEHLTPENFSLLQQFNDNPTTSALILRGLPIDAHMPPTPYGNEHSMTGVPLAVAMNTALYGLLGIHPVTYQGENSGKLFRDVVPKKSGTKEKSSYGSAQTLGMHVDDCHLPLVPETDRKNLSLAPEYLSLFSMRCDLRVATEIAFLDEVLAQLSDATVEILRAPLFELTMPDSFENPQKFVLPALVEDTDGTYYARFDKEYTRFLSPDAERAFLKFEEVVSKPEIVKRLFLLPGDFLIFKNQRVTHARRAFTARFDGSDRWLLRLFGVNAKERIIRVEENNPYLATAS